MKTVTFDPKKYKVVPIEPTDAMLYAVWNTGAGAMKEANKLADHIYRSMIAAAPKEGE
jgi:hypothetical protein